MEKLITKYSVGILNHQGDGWNLLFIIIYAVMFICTWAFFDLNTFTNGMQVVHFDRIVPKGLEAFSYYNIPDPESKAKRDQEILEMKMGDVFMTHFTFNDVNRILPSNDEACPGDG